MTVHEIQTPLAPAEVIERARSFFALAGTPYAAFAGVVAEGFLKLHMEVGEIVIVALPRGDSTWVQGSASRGEHLLTRCLTTLAPPPDAMQATHRDGVHETRSAGVETPESAAPALPETGARPAAEAA